MPRIGNDGKSASSTLVPPLAVRRVLGRGMSPVGRLEGHTRTRSATRRSALWKPSGVAAVTRTLRGFDDRLRYATSMMQPWEANSGVKLAAAGPAARLRTLANEPVPPG